jgi:hypothetical protein
MDALAVLRSKIPSFPGYSDEDSRRLSDKLVRSYLGETLALLQDRLSPGDPSIRERLADVILRAEFTNQVAFKAFEYVGLDDAHVDEIAECDVALIELADRAAEIGDPALSTYLNEIRAAFDERDRVMEDATAA